MLHEEMPHSQPSPGKNILPDINSHEKKSAPQNLDELLKAPRKEAQTSLFTKKRKNHKQKRKAKERDNSFEFLNVSYSPLYRSFRAIFGFLLLMLTIFMGVVFAKEQVDAERSILLSIRRGQTFVSDEFQNKEIQVRGTEYTLSSGEKVRTEGEESEILLDVAGQAEIRGYGATDFIFKKDGGVITIDHFAGDIWVFAPQTVKISFQPYSFTLQDGSARFVAQENMMIVKAWENSVTAVLRDEETEEEFQIVLAPMSQAIFPISEKNLPEMDVLKQLRFSKLLKEFHITSISEDRKDKKNLRRDEYLSQEVARSILQNGKKTGDIREFLNRYFAFFPSRRKAAAERTVEGQYTALLESIFLKTFQENQNIDFSGSKGDLLSFLWKLQMVEDVSLATDLRHQTEDVILLQSREDQRPQFEKIALQNATHALQEAFTRQDAQWADLEIQRIQYLWPNIQKRHSKDPSFLSFYREVFFRLFLSYPEQVSERLFAFLDSLDTNEVAVAFGTERATTLIEIIQKNLSLSQALTVSKNLTLAQDILRNADKKIDRIAVLEDDPLYRNTLQQRENVMIRLKVCRIFDQCADADFAKWRKKQKVLACHIDNICTSNGFSEWLREYVSDGTLKASPIEFDETPEDIDVAIIGQQMLQAAEIEIHSGYTTDNNFFFISKAITKNGFEFSGRLSVEHGYLEDVLLLQDPQVEVSGRHTLQTLERAISFTLFPEEEYEPPSEEILSSAPTLDPVVADVTIRNLQKELAEQNIIVLLIDMNPLSTRNVLIDHAIVGEQQIPVQFEYVFRSSTGEHILKNIILKSYSNVSTEEVALSRAVQHIYILDEQGQRNNTLIQMARGLLVDARFQISEEDFSMKVEENHIVFSAVKDMYNNRIKGELEVETAVFLEVQNMDNSWSAQNITLSGYENFLNPPEAVENVLGNVSEDDLALIDDILNQN